jgi:hypothetical protein
MRLQLRLRRMQAVLILPVGGAINNDLCVVSCRHFEEKFLFRSSSWNQYFLFLSSGLDIMSGWRLREALSVVLI